MSGYEASMRETGSINRQNPPSSYLPKINQWLSPSCRIKWKLLEMRYNTCHALPPSTELGPFPPQPLGHGAGDHVPICSHLCDFAWDGCWARNGPTLLSPTTHSFSPTEWLSLFSRGDCLCACLSSCTNQTSLPWFAGLCLLHQIMSFSMAWA